MGRLKIVVFCVCFSMSFSAFGGKLSKAYDALKIYNYFEAKRLFEKSLKKESAPAAYGLSNIYFRADNPFSNIDSAYHYIILSEKKIQSLSEKNKIAYSKYGCTAVAIDSLKNRIHEKAFDFYKRQN
ncbi:MAG: hypothetical protein IPP64_04230 [Bacteroidetes bacterium]|nr:hypothetical protein [Bacteroidota bacterium]